LKKTCATVARTLLSFISLRRFGKDKKPSGEGKGKCMSTSSTKKAAAKKPEILRHYTSIENLFKILDSGYLLLGDPEKWEDKNDSAALQAFGRLNGNGTKTRVVCFLDGEESIYHWQFHAPKGCCISFDRNEILEQAKGSHFLHDKIEYKKSITAAELNELILKPKGIEKIPFLKRSQFQCEGEYRIIWFGTGEVPKIHFKREAIINITLSPEIAEINLKNLGDYLKKKYRKKIQLSRVLELPEWIRIFENLGKRNPKKRKT